MVGAAPRRRPQTAPVVTTAEGAPRPNHGSTARGAAATARGAAGASGTRDLAAETDVDAEVTGEDDGEDDSGFGGSDLDRYGA